MKPEMRTRRAASCGVALLIGFRSFHLGTHLTGNRGRIIAAHDVVWARSGTSMGLRVPSASGRRSFFSRAIFKSLQQAGASDIPPNFALNL